VKKTKKLKKEIVIAEKRGRRYEGNTGNKKKKTKKERPSGGAN
jgi:hypothetical protein